MRYTTRVIALPVFAGLALGMMQCTKGGVTLVPERGDVWQPPCGQADREPTQATVADDDLWKRARVDMLSLYQTLVMSPDLAPAHAEKLAGS